MTATSIEEAAIAQCQAGDQQAFGVLYEAHVEAMYAYFFYRVQERELAEDLVSQLFMRALSRIKQYKGEKGSFKGWLYRLARNILIDHYRSHKKVSSLEEAEQVAGKDDVAKAASTRHQLAAVEAYLQKLPDAQRDMVYMRLWDELSYEEIAELTGKSIGSCKMILSRTLRTVRHDLAHVLLGFILMIITLQ
ncbi:MAG TPA: sigma-70 family RNA polymerase sigma factor [Verrucomicrobiae bacterium]|nr:sigma-70 family RNA polymerase sigma factor [Verrucomicrobiae bacterium]